MLNQSQFNNLVCIFIQVFSSLQLQAPIVLKMVKILTTRQSSYFPALNGIFTTVENGKTPDPHPWPRHQHSHLPIVLTPTIPSPPFAYSVLKSACHSACGRGVSAALGSSKGSFVSIFLLNLPVVPNPFQFIYFVLYLREKAQLEGIQERQGLPSLAGVHESPWQRFLDRTWAMCVQSKYSPFRTFHGLNQDFLADNVTKTINVLVKIYIHRTEKIVRRCLAKILSSCLSSVLPFSLFQR